MKTYVLFLLTGFIVFYFLDSYQPQNLTSLKGPYLGQNPPGDKPEIFAPGNVSLGFHELGISFSPDLKEMYYIMSDGNYELYVIVQRKMINSNWSEPQLTHFSGEYSIYAQCLSPDGNMMFFSWKRPVNNEVKKDLDIWKVRKNGSVWGNPQRLSTLINTDKSDIVHSVSKNGDLYFFRENNIYVAKFKNNDYEPPVELDKKVNAEYSACRPFISPDEEFLLFHANEENGFGGNDLYVMFKNDDNAWTAPVNLGAAVNSDSHDFGPYVSPDGKYLFFSSYKAHPPETFKNKSYDQLLALYREPQNGYATLYWIDASVIYRLKPEK